MNKGVKKKLSGKDTLIFRNKIHRYELTGHGPELTCKRRITRHHMQHAILQKLMSNGDDADEQKIINYGVLRSNGFYFCTEVCVDAELGTGVVGS